MQEKNTVFSTRNFSLAGVWLLIEGSSYSRMALINFGAIHLCTNPVVSCDRLFFRTTFRIDE